MKSCFYRASAILLFISLSVIARGERNVVNTMIIDLKKVKVASAGKKLFEKERMSNEAIRKRVMGHLDFDQMTEKALGKHSRGVSESRIKRFRNLFEKLMLKSLSNTGGSKSGGGESFFKKYSVRILPGVTVQAGNVNVRTVLSRRGEENTEVVYVFHAGKIIDLSIDEESLMENFREQFSEVISGDGFGGLIKLMEERLVSDGRAP